jgi:hypothetical protein
VNRRNFPTGNDDSRLSGLLVAILSCCGLLFHEIRTRQHHRSSVCEVLQVSREWQKRGANKAEMKFVLHDFVSTSKMDEILKCMGEPHRPICRAANFQADHPTDGGLHHRD